MCVCFDLYRRKKKNMTDYEEQVRIARIFNTYGPRMCIDDGRVVSNFVAQVIRKKKTALIVNEI